MVGKTSSPIKLITKAQVDASKVLISAGDLKGHIRHHSPPVPIKPLYGSRRGSWGWCGVGEGAISDLVDRRHFATLEHELWPPEPEATIDRPAIKICTACAVKLMELTGHGSRLPYETEIPAELGGLLLSDGTLGMSEHRARLAATSRKAKMTKTGMRLEIVLAKLEEAGSSGLSWQDILKLRNDDGLPLFPSLDSVKNFRSKHISESSRVRGQGREARIIYVA